MRSVYKSTLAAAAFLFIANAALAQNAVAIGTPNTDPTAVLLLQGNGTQGLIIPTANLTADGAKFGTAGMIVYNTADNKVYYFDGSAWKTVGAAGSAGTTYTLGFDAATNKVKLIDNLGATVSTAAIEISGATISTVGPSVNQVLAYDGTNWKAATLQGDITINAVASSSGVSSYNVTGIRGKSLPASFSAGALTSDATGNLTWAAGGASTVISDGTTIQGDGSAGNKLAVKTIAAANLGASSVVGGTAGTIQDGTITAADLATNISISTTGNIGTTGAGALSVASGKTTFGTAGYTWPAGAPTAGFLQTDASGNLSWAAAGGTGTVTQIIAGAGLTGGTITTNGTIAVDAGTTANKIVQLNGTAQLPAVDGSLLTALNASNISSGTLGLSRLTSGTNGQVLAVSAGVPAWQTIADANVGAAAAIAGTKINPGFGAQNISTTGTLSSGAATHSSLTVPGTTTLNGKAYNWPASITAGVLTTDASGNLSWAAAGGTGTVTQIVAGTGLTGGTITTNGTIAVDAGTTANKIVQLNGTAQLPAVDGSLLTSLNATNISSGTLALSRLTTGTNGQVLTVSGGVPSWQAASGLSSALTAGSIFVGSAGNVATAQSLSGDGTLSVAGALTLSNSGSTRTNLGLGSLATLSTIADANVSAAAAIAGTKINPAFGAQNISTTGTLSSGAATVTGLTVSGASTTLNTKTYTWPNTLSAGFLQTDISGNLSWAAAGGSGTVTQIIAGSGLTGGTITTNGTIAVDAGTTANKIVQLNASAQLPALDGSLLTSLNASNISSGTLALSRLTTGTNGQVLTVSGGVPSWQAVSGFANPMTAAGDIIYGGAAGLATRLATGIGFLRGGVTPSYSAVNLASTDVSGILPIANGGTGAITPATALANLGGMTNVLASSKIFVGNAGNVAAAQTLSGDGTLSNTGVLTLANLASTRTNLGLGSLATLSTIADADVSATAAIAGTKINPAFGAQNISTTGTLSSGATTVTGLTVSGASTTLNTKTYTWPNSGGTAGTVLTNDGAGALSWGSVGSFLPSVLTSGNIIVGNSLNIASPVAMSGDATIDNTGKVTLANSGTTRSNLGLGSLATLNAVTTTEITDGTIADIDVSATAAIAGTKISPDFGTQNMVTTGTFSSGAATVTGGLTVSGNVGIGTTAPGFPLDVKGNIVNSSPTNGTLGLTGDLPGYSTGVYPTLKTSGGYLYFSAGGNYSGYLAGNTADASMGLNNAATVATVVLNTNGISYLNGGYVGIGTSAPAGKLEVAGAEWNVSPAVLSSAGTTAGATLRFSNAASGNHTYDVIGSTGPGSLLGTGAFGIWDATGGAYRFSIAPSGAVNIPGTLSKGAGTFKIDHPADPENKFLYHSFVESPDMMNVYNGNITTSSNGEAVVNLPGYFESLNKDFRYQLTVIGEFAQAIVYRKIENNKFVIKTDKPNIEVSWQVTGIRKDPFAEKNRVIPEVLKSADEKGKYLHPEAYGLPPEKGMLNKDHP